METIPSPSRLMRHLGLKPETILIRIGEIMNKKVWLVWDKSEGPTVAGQLIHVYETWERALDEMMAKGWTRIIDEKCQVEAGVVTEGYTVLGWSDDIWKEIKIESIELS